jgi:hypothetical protein
LETLECRRMLSMARWSATATNADTGSAGDGITLTWSVVPDGTPLGSGHGEPNTASSLRSILNLKYGSESNWVPVLQGVFNGWSAATGVSYQYVGDDGAAFPSSPGVLGSRGDVRIGAHPIDGIPLPPAQDTLAYNQFPANGGDMVFDSDDLLFGPTFDPAAFRNTMAHEHGHGLGLIHTLPQNLTKLMEPVLNTNFAGPQFDDIYRAQALYGDVYEKGAGNDDQPHAVQLGTNPGVNIGHLSLASSADQDWFKFTLSTRKRIDMIALPEGSPYMVGEGDHSTPTLFDPRIVADMKLNLLNSSGTIVGTSDIPGTGNMESIGMDLNAGTYYADISRPVAGGTQMYSFSVQTSESAPVATIAQVSPDPRSSPVTSMTISFDKPVNGFDVGDLTLSRDTNATSLASAMLTTSDNQNFTLNNLSAITDRVGTFTLTLNAAGSGITSQVGNVAMTQNASESWQMTQINGTSGADNVLLARDPFINNQTNVYVNNVFQYWFLNTTSMLMSASLGGGADTFTVDYSNGLMLPGNVIAFDGGGLTDTLQVNGSFSNDTFNVAPNQLAFGGSTVLFTSTEIVSLSMDIGNDSATVYAATGVQVRVDGGPDQDSVTFNTPAANSFMTATSLGFSSNTTSVTITGGVEHAYMQGNSNTGVTYLVSSTATGRPLTVTGGSSDEQFNVLGMDSANFPAPVTITGGGGTDHLHVDDSGIAGNSTYQIGSNHVQKSNGFAGVQYGNLNSLDLSAETGNNVISVYEAGQVNAVSIDSGAGDDVVAIASTAGHTINVDGSTGSDTVIFQEPAAGSLMRAYFNQFFSETTGVNFSNCEAAQMRGNANPATFLVGDSIVGCPISVFGGIADENFRLENTSGALYQSPTTIEGGAGNNTLTIDDSGSPGAPPQLIQYYTTAQRQILKSDGFAGLTYNDVAKITIKGDQWVNFFRLVTVAGTPIYVDGGGSVDQIFADEGPASAPVVVLSAAGGDSLLVNQDNAGTAFARVDSTMGIAAIGIYNGGQLDALANANITLVTNYIEIGAQGRLNLNNNDFIAQYTPPSPIAAFQNWVNSARAGGSWNGYGITSVTARDNPQHNTTLGVMEATEYKSIYGQNATFNGLTLNDTSIIIKYTYYGDADFNGKVNFDDYVRTDTGFNNHRTGWLNGDFDGNGRVNFDDYVLIDLAFNTQGPVL